MRVKIYLVCTILLMVGCAQYDSGRAMPLGIFHEKLSKLTTAQYLTPIESEMLIANSTCVPVGHHRIAAPIGAFLGGDMKNAADAVDSRVIYIDRADSYAINNFKWIEAESAGTQLNVQITSINCNPTSLTTKAEAQFDTDFNVELRRKEAEVNKARVAEKAAKKAAWDADAPARRAAWERITKSGQPQQAPINSTKKKSTLNGAYLTGQTSIVGGSMCKYSDGSVVKISGSYCPRRN
jgi:hypothetical protein